MWCIQINWKWFCLHQCFVVMSLLFINNKLTRLCDQFRSILSEYNFMGLGGQYSHAGVEQRQTSEINFQIKITNTDKPILSVVSKTAFCMRIQLQVLCRNLFGLNDQQQLLRNKKKWCLELLIAFNNFSLISCLVNYLQCKNNCSAAL